MRFYELINESVAPQTKTLGGFPVKVLNVEETGVEEALKLDAPHEVWPRDELHQYLNRIKTDTKTKQDIRTKPIIHASNVKAIIKSNDPNDLWDLDELAALITQRPSGTSKLIGVNAKMTSTANAVLSKNSKISKSGTKSQKVFDITLPALSGIVVDEETGDFVEISTCISAGECKLFCYARKGGYRQFPGSSLSAARTLNFLVNDPQGYMAMLSSEIGRASKNATRQNTDVIVRWHDAGDFFSKEYLDLAYGVANQHPNVRFYFYTKVADVATGDKPPNVVINFSQGAIWKDQQKIDQHIAAGNKVKQAMVIPKDMWNDLVKYSENPVKGGKRIMSFNNNQAFTTFKQRLASKYNVDPKSIITYDQMMTKKEGNDPYWNVIVTPNDGDNAAYRHDVLNSFLLYH